MFRQVEEKKELRVTEMVIRPFEGFGPIDFGMTRVEIEASIGVPDSVYVAEWTQEQQLYYDKLGIRIDLAPDSGACQFVEGRRPCVPVFASVRIFGLHDEVVALLEQFGYEAHPDDHGDTTRFDTVGIGLWREDVRSQKVDSVGAWRRGYWDDADKRTRIREAQSAAEAGNL